MKALKKLIVILVVVMLPVTVMAQMADEAEVAPPVREAITAEPSVIKSPIR
jgi:hypothetical protein